MKKRLLIGAVALFLLIFTFHAGTRPCFDFLFPFEYWTLAPVVAINILLLIVFFILDHSKKTKYWKIPATFILSVMTGFGAGCIVSNLQNDHAVENMDRLAQSLESFKKTTDYYPKELKELVPGYISEIPVSYCGFEKIDFEYYRTNDTIHGEGCMLRIYDRKHITYRQYNNGDDYKIARITSNDYFNH